MNKRLCLIIEANLGQIMTVEELLACREVQSGLLSCAVFEKSDIESFNLRFDKVLQRLDNTPPYSLSDLNNRFFRDLPIDLRIDLISLIDACQSLMKCLYQKLAGRKADWALYKQVCILLSFCVLFYKHLDGEIIYNFIGLCRQKDLFLS